MSSKRTSRGLIPAISDRHQRLQVSRLQLGQGIVFRHYVPFRFAIVRDDLSKNYASGYLHFHTGGVLSRICCFRATPEFTEFIVFKETVLRR